MYGIYDFEDGFSARAGHYIKFDGERIHAGGANHLKETQFRVQLLFAMREMDMPPFDSVATYVLDNSKI